MATATVTWVKESQFVGSDGNQHSIVLSGDNKASGISPSQTLLVALASCSSVDVVEIMKKKRKPVNKLEVTVTGEQDDTPPWPYRKIHLVYHISGEGLTEKAVKQAIDLSMEKYCSVAATIRGVAKITTEFQIL